MDKLFTIIYHEVLRQYRSERAFYKEALGINQNAWEKYKSGDTFKNIKMSTYRRMVGLLFTSYEALLLDKAVNHSNLYHVDPVDAFHELKIRQAKMMVADGAEIRQAGAIYETGQPIRKNTGTRIYIADKYENSISFFLNTTPSKIPSGKQNRREWFEKEFEKVVIH